MTKTPDRLPSSFDKLDLSQKHARKTLFVWKMRALRAARAHYRYARHIQIIGKVLTLFNSLAAIIVSLVSVAGFFSPDKFLTEPFFGWYINLEIVAICSGVVVLLTSIVQFLEKPEEHHLLHKSAANEFSNLQRKIERYLAASQVEMGVNHNINRDFNFVSKSFPMVSSRCWNHNRKVIDRLERYEAELEQEAWAAGEEV